LSNYFIHIKNPIPTPITINNRLSVVLTTGLQKITNFTFDILPSLKAWGFWGQTAIAGVASLILPNPIVDAPTI
jgi:hypothetical protein